MTSTARPANDRRNRAAAKIREAQAEQLGEYQDGTVADPEHAEGSALIAQGHALLAIEGAIRDLTFAVATFGEQLSVAFAEALAKQKK